jgi:SAM-dependent methyltransferase
VPTSQHWQIPYVLDVIASERPDTVLDVGSGFGKYGTLAREYAAPSRVDALDMTAPRFPGYDHVYLGDLRELDRVLPLDAPRYDLALFVDVIEHFEKAEGHRVLAGLLKRSRRVLVTTPLGFRAQEIPGMPFETHRSGWWPWDFGGYRVRRRQIFPGHFSRHLKLPRLWQLLVVVEEKSSPV